MTKQSMEALKDIRSAINALLNSPDNFEMIDISYRALVATLRYECSEMEELNDEYVEKSLALQRCEIVKSICRLVEDIDKWEED